MTLIREEVRSGRILVSDGAWGTFLQKSGLTPGECPELWSITHRPVVLDIAKSYVSAGADMIESNTFGANKFKLAHFDLAKRVTEINRVSAEISREAAGSKVHVIASVGPTGKILLQGDVSENELYDAFSEQMTALEAGGADACIETMSALDEAILAVKAAKDNTSLEIICTFTFERSLKGGFRTMMGVSPCEMTMEVAKAGAHVIGTNCGNGMSQMAEIVTEIRKREKHLPILVHANAGKPVLEKGKSVFPESPAEMASNTLAVIKAGANIVGGCCGTTPDHIKAIAKSVHSL